MKSNNNKVFLIVMILWTVITLLRVAFHQPWFDEAHAYIIAKELSPLDVISLMNVEGHTFIWYFLLMPFAKADICYPYPMLILNWLFMFFAMLVFWKKAPLHSVTKTVVSFSYIFLAQLPVVARCYAIGVLFLFMLAAFYKERLEKPLIYAACITLCANTSVIALFGAVGFGFVFAYDLIKGALNGLVSRKDFRIAFVILAIGAVLILWQLGCSNANFINEDNQFLYRFSSYLISENPNIIDYLNIFALASVILALPVYCFKNKRVFFILLFPIAAMLYTFLTKYGGGPHHYIFFYIFALIGLWIMKYFDVSSKKAVVAEIAVALLFFAQIFSHMSYTPGYFNSGSKVMVDVFITDEVKNNGKIMIFKAFDMRFIPYIKDKNLDIYYYATAQISDYLTYNTPLLEVAKYYLSPTWIHKVNKGDKQLYGILEVTDMTPAEGFVFEDRDYKMIFEPYKIFNKTYGIFKIIEIKK